MAAVARKGNKGGCRTEIGKWTSRMRGLFCLIEAIWNNESYIKHNRFLWIFDTDD